MRDIGFNDTTIGLMVAVYSAAMLVFETPSGILADRWSRKGVLMLAGAAMVLCALVGGLSYDIPVFLMSMCLWGLFYALYSGTNEAIIYDMLQEEEHDSELFEKAFGRIRIWDSAGLVTGALAGGLIAAAFGARATFFFSIGPAVASVVALAFLREPMLHKAKEAVGLIEHIRDTLRPVLTNQSLVSVLLMLILATLIMDLVYEFSQLWWLAVAMPVVLFGPANALILTCEGVGGYAAQFFQAHRRPALAGLVGVMIVAAAGLVVSHNLAVIVVWQFLLLAGAATLDVIYTRRLHDGLSSNVRAGAASAVSTLGRIALIPVALVFGYASTAAGVFQAGFIQLAAVLVVAGLVLFYQQAPKKQAPREVQ